ncbi:glutaredoxin family protein [Patescibacteria group bacterium]|nr:glutaredoxin family protein [Patescibacteria group bacterium]
MAIIVYSTPTCPYCKLVKEYLHEKNYEYTDVDVSANHDAATKMVKISGQMGVPVIEVDGKVIVGWNKSALEEILAKKTKPQTRLSLAA